MEKKEQKQDVEAILPKEQPSDDVKSVPGICSSMPLSAWKGSVTTFNGFTGTRPDQEIRDVEWPAISAMLCPPGPTVLKDKSRGRYVIPCELTEAPLVGKTLEEAKKSGTSVVGKMRSKEHVTAAAFLLFDVDGLQGADFDSALKEMSGDNVTYCAYTTYSHGDAEKPGIRARVALPVDKPLSNEEYSVACKEFVKLYFGDKCSGIDSTGFKMYQQQGTWCCDPTRAAQADSWSNGGGIASASFLLEKAQPEPVVECKQPPEESTQNKRYPASDALKVADRCQQIGDFRKCKGAGQSEPAWFDCLGVVTHCQDGERYAQEWSSGYQGYGEEETANKIAHRLKIPPTTCEQFRKTSPEGCRGCKETCHSPIALGMGSTELAADALAFIQEKFALIRFGNDILGVDRSDLEKRDCDGVAKAFGTINEKTLKLLIKRSLRECYPEVKAEEIFPEFMVSTQTTMFEGVEFDPRHTTQGYLNLWVGPTIEAREGDWSEIEKFLRDIICSADQEAFDYLIKYLAHALQKPWDKPGVMIILKGGQGTGKGTLGKILRKIWGATYLQVNKVDDVTGGFNSMLERAFPVFMDEAIFAGDRRSSDRLKSLVTESVIVVNQKYQPQRQIKSYHRIFAATNAGHFKNTECDDRRDFVLRVSEARKGAHEYWQKLHAEIENGCVEAMVQDLLAMDLSDFNVRAKPETGELLEEKLISLESIPSWWYECLLSGANTTDGKWPDFMATSDIISEVVESAGKRLYSKPTARSVVAAMKALCPSATPGQKAASFGRSRGLSLPSINQARAEFEKYIGSPLKWEDDAPLEDASVSTEPFNGF